MIPKDWVIEEFVRFIMREQVKILKVDNEIESNGQTITFVVTNTEKKEDVH